MTGEDQSSEASADPKRDARDVPVAWAALEDAFENNAPEVHSYLHLATGDVVRVVDGVADPITHSRIVSDSGYRRVDPVSSREQYRWMERFIATVDDLPVRTRLLQSIDGKGAFRRFKDVLMTLPVERERWFAFRSERLRMCMEAWIEAQGLSAVPRPDWPVPSVAEMSASATEEAFGPMPLSLHPSAHASLPPTVNSAPPVASASVARWPIGRVDSARASLRELVETLPSRELDAAVAFLEFLHTRRASAPWTDADPSGTKSLASEPESAKRSPSETRASTATSDVEHAPRRVIVAEMSRRPSSLDRERDGEAPRRPSALERDGELARRTAALESEGRRSPAPAHPAEEAPARRAVGEGEHNLRGLGEVDPSRRSSGGL